MEFFYEPTQVPNGIKPLNSYFVTFSDETLGIMGVLKAINLEGLVLEYSQFDWSSMQGSVEATVFSEQGGFFLRDVPSTVLYDVRVCAPSFCRFPRRECGVRFESLTDQQRERIALLLSSRPLEEAGV